MAGIVAYSSYYPRWRLRLGAGARGRLRSVAGADEDSVTMGVAAARGALRGCGDACSSHLWFATSRPPYLEKSAGATVAAAASLPGIGVTDLAGSVAAGAGALVAAVQVTHGLAVLSDVRFGSLGSVDEQQGGDGAAAFLTGDEHVIAELLAVHELSEELLDRWRADGQGSVAVWDERFAAAHYAPVVAEAIRAAARMAGRAAGTFDHVLVSTPYARLQHDVVRQLGRQLATQPGDLGFIGVADVGVRMAGLLDKARPGETILVTAIADGVTVIALRVTSEIDRYRARLQALPAPMLEAESEISFLDYLQWRELLARDPARRRVVSAPSAPGTARGRGWKYGLVGTRCACGALNLPPQRVCFACRQQGKMTPEAVGDRRATVVTYTEDHLAPSGRPEAIAVLNFDGGGRIEAYLTNVEPGQLVVGSRVGMVYRLLGVGSNGVRNYFWKGVVERTRT